MAKNPDDSFKAGSGYVVAPYLRTVPFFNSVSNLDRLPLDDTNKSTASVKPFDIQIELAADNLTYGARAFGGFTQTPIRISLKAESTFEFIDSVSLVVDGQIFDALTQNEISEDGFYHFAWVPDGAQTYTVSGLVRDVTGNVVSTPPSIVTTANYSGSGIAIKMLGDSNYTVEPTEIINVEFEASSEFGVSEIEIFIDNKPAKLVKSTGQTLFQIPLDLSELSLSQGMHELSVVVRDSEGNQAGTFSHTETNIKSRKNRKLEILSDQANAPIILSPVTATAQLQAVLNENNGIEEINVIDGGLGYRFPPRVVFEGGGERSAAVATPVIKNGIISKIEIESPGSGYDQNITFRLLDNGEEHGENSRAILRPVLSSDGGISEIIIEDGGKNYSPGQRPIVVLVDYNGTIGGSGFKAGPIHTQDGAIEKVNIDFSGDYVLTPIVTVEGGGHEYTEGEAVRIRVLSNTPNDVKNIRLIPVGLKEIMDPEDYMMLAKNRGPGDTGSDYAEVVSNDPYFELFWVPDRNVTSGLSGLDGVGEWNLKVEIEDTMDVKRTSKNLKISVNKGAPPSVSLVTPEDGASFVFDIGNSISLVADALDEDGVVREVQFLVNDLTTDFNGSASYLVESEPYILNWRPQKIGEYRIKALAIDNSGLSTLSAEHVITVKDAEGEKPFAVWRGPEEVTDRTEQYYSYYYYYYYGARR